MWGLPTLLLALLVLACAGGRLATENGPSQEHLIESLRVSDLGRDEMVRNFENEALQNANKILEDVHNPRILTTTRYSLSDPQGSIDIRINTVQDSFRWNITPSFPSASAIRIVIKSMKLINSELRIYDISENFAPLWSCASCGSIPPPTIVSKTGSIIIKISASNAVSFTNNFADILYFSELIEYASELNSTKINLFTGYDKIEPILVDDQFISKTSQLCNISTPMNRRIIFSISDYSFGSSCLSYLEIYDGIFINSARLLYRGCVDNDYEDH